MLGRSVATGHHCPLPEEAPELWVRSAVPAAKLTARPWELTASSASLLEKLRQFTPLESIAQVIQGTGTRADKVFLVEGRGREQDLVRIFSFEQDTEYLLEVSCLKPALRGRSISRYQISEHKLLLLVPYKTVDGKKTLISHKTLGAVAPRTLAYFADCRGRLDEREKGRFKGENWYCYGRPQNLDRFEIPEKIVLPDVANRGAGFLDEKAAGCWTLPHASLMRPGALPGFGDF